MDSSVCNFPKKKRSQGKEEDGRNVPTKFEDCVSYSGG